MEIERGDVVWGPDPFKEGFRPRPWLILNNDTHPFGEEESIAVTLTTTERKEAVPIDDTEWERGGSPRKSYVSPWVVTTHKHIDLEEKQGRLKKDLVDRVTRRLTEYLTDNDE